MGQYSDFPSQTPYLRAKSEARRRASLSLLYGSPPPPHPARSYVLSARPSLKRTLEWSAFLKPVYGGIFTISTKLLSRIFALHSPPRQNDSFFKINKTERSKLKNTNPTLPTTNARLRVKNTEINYSPL